MMSSSKTLHYLSQYISDTKAVAYYTSNVNIVYNTITSNYTSNLTYAPVYTYDTLYSYVNKTSNLFDSNIKIPYNEIVSVNEIAPNEDASTADYFYYSFTDTSINASNYITFSSNTVCDVLIVGGGGSGAIGLGGGSSGGLLYAKGVNIPAGQYPITVGIGGNNGNGGASSAFGATAKGGLQATTLTGATNNGVNELGSTITTWNENKVGLSGGNAYIQSPIDFLCDSSVNGGITSTINTIITAKFDKTRNNISTSTELYANSDMVGRCTTKLQNGVYGCLFEGGATGDGVYLGLRQDAVEGTILRLRAGNGGTAYTYTQGLTHTNTRMALLDIPYTDGFEKYDDGVTHEIVWEVRIGKDSTYSGRVRIWIDGELMGTATTYGTNNRMGINGAIWAGPDPGSFGKTPLNVCVGELLQQWPLLDDLSQMDYYRNRLVNTDIIPTTVFTQTGGSGFQVSIRKPNEFFAGGGGANGGKRVPMTGYTIGYGGNSSELSGENGGDGIIIVSIPISKDIGSVYNTNKIIDLPSASTSLSYGFLNNPSYYYYSFTDTTKTNYINFYKNTTCDVLIVGGGGSGAIGLGGGSSGGLLYSSNVIIPPGEYPITVGAGGKNANDGNGGASTAFGATVYGGMKATTIIGATKYLDNNITGSIISSAIINKTALGGGNSQNVGLVTYLYDQIITAVGATAQQVSGNINYYYYTFTSTTPGANSITFSKDITCDILLVGGGGAGNSGFGGGSAGAVIYYNNVPISSGTYQITVGNGGQTSGENGTSSTFYNAIAFGGRGAITIDGASSNIGSNVVFNNGTMIINEQAKLGGASYTILADPFFNDTSNLLAWYKFDDNANDSSGNNKHLTLYNNPTPPYDSTITIDGSSVNIDGDTYLQNSTSGTYFTPSNLSISFWLYGGSQSTTHQAILSARKGSPQGGWIIYIPPSTNNISFWVGANPWNTLDVTVSDLFSTSWKFFTITYSSTNALKIYKNGVSIYSGTLSTSSRTADNFRIGAGANEQTPLFYLNNGSKIDDCRIYNKILSVDEISILYNRPKSVIVSGGGGGTNSITGNGIQYTIGNIPNGGSPLSLDITGTNINVAGGGGGSSTIDSSIVGLQQGTESSEIYGYGGNSRFDTFTPGVSGVVIIRVPTIVDIMDYSYQSISSFSYNEVVTAVGATPEQVSGNSDYYYYAFTDSTAVSKSITFSKDTVCDILIVGGGGGGGGSQGGGGGGAGGLVFYPNALLNGTVQINIGSGGAGGGGGYNGAASPGINGGDSSIITNGTTITAVGGGGGGQGSTTNGVNGGSGGGKRTNTSGTQSSSTQPTGDSEPWKGYGNKGGFNIGNNSVSGGGGGAGEEGYNNYGFQDTSSTLSSTTARNEFVGRGGDGLSEVVIDGTTYNFKQLFGNSLSGGEYFDNQLYFAGGGAGSDSGGKTHICIGGLGGGADSAPGNDPGNHASPNTGGGGSGGNNGNFNGNNGVIGGNGGSGIVIIRVPAVIQDSVTLNVTTPTGGGGIGSFGESITELTTPETPINGGAGFPVSIRAPNELFAGGGGANGGTRISASGKIIGYGGNSSSTTAEDGGDGIVIIRFAAEIEEENPLKSINKITGSTTTILDDNLTPNKIVITDATGKINTSNNITLTEFEYLSGVEYDIQQQFIDTSNYYDIMSSNINSNILATSNAIIDNFVNINTYLINTSNNLSSNLNSLNLENINVMANTRKVIVNNTYNDDLTINAKLTINSNLNISGTASEIFAPIFNTEALEINTLISLPNPILQVNYTGTSNILEIYSNTSIKTVVSKEGYLGIGNTNPQFGIDVSSNINISGNYKINGTNLSYYNMSNVPLTFNPSIHDHVISDITDLQTQLDSKQDIIPSISSSGDTITIDADVNLTTGNNYTINGVTISSSGEVVSQTTTQTLTQYIDPIIEGTLAKTISGTSYQYAAFTNISATNSIKFLQDTICDVLIVGGGGSGAIGLGGGSSGGMLYAINQTINTGTYSITVGAGGVNGNGGDSVAFGATAKGGLQATHATGATNNGANIPGTTIAVWNENKVALEGGTTLDLAVIKYPKVLYTTTSTDITYSSKHDEAYVDGWRAFDGSKYEILSCYMSGPIYNGGTHTGSENIEGYSGEWLRIDLKENIILKNYYIYPEDDYPSRTERGPRDFAIFASKDNITHVKIDEQTDITYSIGQRQEFYLPNNNESYRYYTIIVNKITHTNDNAQFIITEWELYGIEPTPPSGGGGIGSVGGPATTPIDTPSGGDGFPVSIRAPNELFAGGGGANGGTRVPATGYTIGYGGNSTATTAEDGGDGIVIIRWNTAYTPKKIDSWKSLATTIQPVVNSYNFYNETSNLLVWYKFDQVPSNNLTLTNYGIGNETSSTYDGIVTMNGVTGSTLTQNNEYYPDTNNYNWSSTIGATSENYISVNNAPQLLDTMMTSDYSISFWKTSYDVSVDYSVYARNDATIPAIDDANSLIRIQTPSSDNIIYYDNGNFTGTTYNRLQSTAITGYTGLRQLYTFTRKIYGANEILSAYINGNLLTNSTYIAPTVIGTTITPITGTSYVYAAFTTVGSANSIYFPQNTVCDILVVGGGGGGGWSLAGGGGAGSVIHIINENIPSGKYDITIGDGGSAGSSSSSAGKGGNTIISKLGNNIVIAEGGGGGNSGAAGNSGGSGSGTMEGIYSGGAVGTESTTGFFTGIIYGNKGGDIKTNRVGTPYGGSGGGGAGSPARNIITSSTASIDQGSGGDGIQINIDGNNYYWGGGGGGTGHVKNGGDGGKGGGGGGASGFLNYTAIGGGNAINSGENGGNGAGTKGGNGGANTGGGGGASTWISGGALPGGTGGSGIVIIRWQLPLSVSQPVVSSDAKFYIGLNKNASFAFKNKSMGDFRIYNRVITTAEMSDLYNIARKTQIVSIPKQINNYTSYYEFKTPVGQINTLTKYPRELMTANTLAYTDGKVVNIVASSFYPATENNAFNAFNGILDVNGWHTSDGKYTGGIGNVENVLGYKGEWLMIDLGEVIMIDSFKIYQRISAPSRMPKKFRFYASNDINCYNNVNHFSWNLIYDDTGSYPTSYAIRNCIIGSTKPYRYFFIVVNENYNDGWVQIAELEIYGYPTSAFKTNTITFTKDTVCDVLVVGGGGSGGVRCGGGGGAGACIYMQNYTFPSGTYDIVVGDGGTSVANTTNAIGNHGDDSYIQKDGVDIFRAIGGGGGGYDGTNDILPGGSSGGAAGSKTTSENISTLNIPQSVYTYGNKGGIGLNNANTYYAGGGGGGADNVGGNAVTHSSTTGYGGAGGEGRLINITGRELYYAAGGGGGIGPTGIGGQGGSGIGGNGSVLQETALNGLANTGSGGGGSGFANGTNLNGISGAGGSGIVIIRWNNFADNSHINYNDVEVYNNNVVIGKTKYLDNFKQYGEIRKYPPIASTFTSTGGSFTELSSTITGQLYGNGTYVSSQSTILGGYSSVYLFDDVIGTDAGIHDASKFTSPAGNISSSGSILNNTNYIGEWIKFKIPSQIYLAYVKIYGRSNLLSRSPSFYRVYGSNDDINWTLLIDNNKEAIYNNLTDTNNSVLVHKTKIANLKQSDKFLYFALCINKIKGYGVYNDYLNFSELEFYGSETFTKVDMVSNYDFYTDTTDMKVWYKLEDLNDSSGNGLTLINSGATFDTTVVGNYVTGTGAIQLGTSASAYVKSPYDYYFSGNTSFTYAFWLKSNNNSANNQVIINSRNNTTQGWNVVRLQNESTIYFEVFKSTTTATKKYEVGSSWNHFVCVLEYVSATQQNMSIYMNGVFKEVVSGNIYDPWAQGELYFGKSATGTAFTVADNTFIDDFRMYNRVLNLDEIQILYDKRKIEDRTIYDMYYDKTNLALHYDFDTTNVLLNKGYLGTEYNLTCTGTLQSESGAVNLNNNSYLSVNTALDTTGWTECSICFRLKRTALNSAYDVIFYETSGGQDFVIQRNNVTSTWQIKVFGSGWVYTTATTLNDFTADNIWNHYVFVLSKEGTQVGIKIYKNGVFDPVFTSLNGTWTTSIIPIIMSYNNFDSAKLKGLLDDVRIYDRVLTIDEIKTLNDMGYNRFRPSDYTLTSSTDIVSNTSNTMIVPTGNIVTYTGDIVSESGKINTNNLFINQNLIINTSVRDYSSNILTKYPRYALTNIETSVEKFTNPSINILAWYKFDGNLLDSSGNNRHLTGGTGTSFTSDCKLGNSCISFPNTAAQTVTSSTLSLAGNTSFTISLWTKRATAAKNDFMICAGTTVGTRTLLLISYTTTNYIQFAFYNDDFNTVNTYTDVNTWVHWTFVYNGTTRLRQIYRNGIIENSSTAAGNTNFAATFNIGNRTDVVNGQFSGLIDDVRVFNRDLTPEEIATIYNINPTYNIYNTNKTRIGWDTGSIGLLTAGNGTYPHLPSISISYKKVIASGDIIISDGTATTAVTVNGKTITIPAGYQIWTVPITGSYKLVAGGARGMYLTINTEDGKGIVVSNMVSLTSGEKIIICVGKTPRTTSGSMYSGGGGTFISKLTGLGSDNLFTTLLNHTLLLVAGGGGGAGTASTNNIGTNGVITTSGTLPTGIGSGTVATNGGGGGGKGGAGGNATNGLQGSGTDGSGAGGGGFIGNGGNGTANTGGKSFLNGAQGGITPVTSDISTYAGFGGGGGSWNTGGGGGGYSGGNSHINSARNGGGGGGSYDINGSSFNATQYTNWDLKSISAPSQFLSGYSIDNGFVAIEQSSYASNPVSTTNYITGYPGEYLKLDMGEYILPKYISMTPVTNDFYTNTSNLIAWYKFDGNLLDSSGNNKHLTLYNNPISVYDTIIYNSGISSINFDGDTYLEHLETNYFTSSGDITYSIWIYGGVAGTQQTIFSAREGNNKGIVLFIMADQKIGVYSGNSSWGWAGTYTTAAQVPNLSSNSWKHIVIIKKTDNTISIYYNNVALILNSNPGGVPQINSSTSLRIGGWGITDNAEYLSNGTKIDDFRIYNRALTVNEISILSNLNGSQLALMPAKAPKNFRLYGAQTINNAIIYHNGVLATPLQVSGSTDYYFAFTSTSGQHTITFNEDTVCDILIVGGGGGGGGSQGGGGGGAGGLVFYPNATLNGTVQIQVGAGGTGGGGGYNGAASAGENGGDSSITINGVSITAVGGGGGGQGSDPDGNNGGSGGGKRTNTSGTQSSSTQPTGDNKPWKGYGNRGGFNIGNNSVSGGGGGAGKEGYNNYGFQDTTSTLSSTTARNEFVGRGGDGLSEVVIDGTTYNFKQLFGNSLSSGEYVDNQLYFAGGGAGSDSGGKTHICIGGIGGGADSAAGNDPGNHASPNTGGGGSGGNNGNFNGNNGVIGGNGGSGIVIIRWRGSDEIKNYDLLLDNTITETVPQSDVLTYPLVSLTSYRYFTLVVKDNWEDSLGTAISELEIYGYEQSPIYTKYPRQAMISNTFTYTDGSGITVSVTGSTTIGNQYDYSKSFDNIISLVGDGWASAATKYTASTGLAITTYRTGYAGEYIMIDLGEQITLNNIKIYPRTDNNYQYRTPKEFKIFASNSSTSYGTGNQNTGWTEIYTGSASGDGSQLTPYSYVIGSTTSYRYYMIVINKIFINGVSTLVQIVELELYGTPGNYVTSVSSSKWRVAPSTINELEFSTSTDSGANWITRSMISATATGGYTNFTGIHHCKASSNYLYDNKYIGRIVSTTKKYSSINSVYGDDNIKRNLDKKEWDCLPIVELSSKQNDKNVFGIITKIEDNHSKQREYQTGYMKHYYDKEEFDRRLHIAGVGEGGIWVCDYNTSNSNIESGDYITSSPILGFGMKQHDDLQHSYTVAKATMDCDFNPKLLPVKVIATSNILVETIDNTPTIFKNVIIDSLNNEVYTSNFDNDIKCMFELYNLNSSSNIQNNINVSNIQYDINIHNININNSSNTLCNINFYYGYLSNYIMINDNIDIYDVNFLKTADITSNSSNNIYYKIYLKDENDEYIYTDLLDDAGNIIYEYEYELQYIYDNGEYITKEEYDICISNNINVYKTAFIGCTYHCS